MVVIIFVTTTLNTRLLEYENAVTVMDRMIFPLTFLPMFAKFLRPQTADPLFLASTFKGDVMFFALFTSAFAQVSPETESLPSAITVKMTQVGKEDRSNILCAGRDAYFIFSVPGRKAVGIGAIGSLAPWSMSQMLDEHGSGRLHAQVTLPDGVDGESDFLVVSDSASLDDIKAFAVHVNAGKRPEDFVWQVGAESSIRGVVNVQVQEPHVNVARDGNNVHWEVFSYVIKRCPAQ